MTDRTNITSPPFSWAALLSFAGVSSIALWMGSMGLWFSIQGWWEYIATSRWSHGTAAIELAAVSAADELIVEYRYKIDGVCHTGSRVAMGARNSMFGAYQKAMAKRLCLRAEQGGKLAIRIHPEEPSQSIALRRISFWMLLLPVLSPVLLIFGLCILLYIASELHDRFCSPKPGQERPPE